jgi:hypothetical protein
MAQTISPLQLNNATQWAGQTHESHLGYLGMQDRIKINDFVQEIQEINYGPEISKFQKQFSTRMLPKDAEYEWYICGPSVKNYPLVDWYDASGNKPAQPGLGGQVSFFMEFAVRMFEITDTIATDSKETYQMRIVSEPVASGNNWKYEVKLFTGDPNLFVPATELVAGTPFGKLFSQTEQDSSQRGGTIQHDSYFKLHNRCSMIRINYDVPGNMINQALADGTYRQEVFQYDKKTGKKVFYWLDKLSLDLRNQFERQKSNLHLYSKWNKTSQGTYVQKGESGWDIKSGAGMFEQIAPSNVRYNTYWDIDFIESTLEDLSFGKLPMDQRKFKIATGEQGYKRFHKLMDLKAFPFGSQVNAGGRITGSGQNLSFGGQFTSVRLINGIEVELTMMPIQDDPTLNTKIHPLGGLASSYELFIGDYGKTQGKDNVQNVSIENNEEAWVYVNGLRNAFSPSGSMTAPGMASSGKDGFSVYGAYWGGMQVNNPTKLARVLNNQI